jgi:perosamine synthetase
MIPRGALDIGWRDLASALVSACVPDDRVGAQARAERVWHDPDRTVACLSLRSGFDLFLQAVAWPRGTEVLVSAVTIPDMVRVLRHHGLVPIPLDVSPDTLTIDERQLDAAGTSSTRAILIAHLFGARTGLQSIAIAARARGWRVLEDCAQAYDGTYHGDPAADVRMFSFGPIKTATALGGALMSVEDAAVARRMRKIQSTYAVQRRGRFLTRVLQACALKVLGRRAMFGVFAGLCRLVGADHDALVVSWLRGFPSDDLIVRIRRAPSAPLCRLLARRLRSPIAARISRRRLLASQILERLQCRAPGTSTADHSHWIIPVESNDPAGLVKALWRRGFDATRRASSLEAVAAPLDRPWLNPARAKRMLDGLVYLPVYPRQSAEDCRRLTACVNEWEMAAGDSRVTRSLSGPSDKRRY